MTQLLRLMYKRVHKTHAVFLCAFSAVVLPAQTFTNLDSFTSSNGAAPYASLVQATNGQLYGTASSGGAFDQGAVFTVGQSGTLTLLYSFCFSCNGIGYNPIGGLVQATDGNLYGATSTGAAIGYGAVYKITPAGVPTLLHSFCSVSGCVDGQAPNGGLVQAASGLIYGTTTGGGVNGHGTIFSITPSGTLTTLYSFCAASGCPDGSDPLAGLTQGIDGEFYGTTNQGGAGGGGTVFKITRTGTLTTLYNFTCPLKGCAGGSTPDFGALVLATDGSLYGTTSAGGTSGDGTVFKITPAGILTTLFNFCGQHCGGGYNAQGGLVQATDGNFYGTTAIGGTFTQFGTLFMMTPSGAMTTLHNFDGADGGFAIAAPVQATNGALYGTTTQYGASGVGTVFGVGLGLSPFVETQTTSGKAGSVVKILGSSLTGATKVTFNGTPAVFTVESKYLIAATIPSGATTGSVVVATPGGTLSSKVPFVIP